MKAIMLLRDRGVNGLVRTNSCSVSPGSCVSRYDGEISDPSSVSVLRASSGTFHSSSPA
jgi:hypothetical protein